MAENLQHVHLDTCYLQDCLWGKPDEQQSADSLLRSLGSSAGDNPLIKVKISFLVVGELVNNFIRDNVENGSVLSKLVDLLKELDVDLIPPREEIYSKAAELHRQDYKIEHVDSLIVGQALCDPYSSHFLTRDPALLESEAIEKLEQKMRSDGTRKRKLRITEEFSRQ